MWITLPLQPPFKRINDRAPSRIDAKLARFYRRTAPTSPHIFPFKVVVVRSVLLTDVYWWLK